MKPLVKGAFLLLFCTGKCTLMQRDSFGKLHKQYKMEKYYILHNKKRRKMVVTIAQSIIWKMMGKIMILKKCK